MILPISRAKEICDLRRHAGVKKILCTTCLTEGVSQMIYQKRPKSNNKKHVFEPYFAARRGAGWEKCQCLLEKCVQCRMPHDRFLGPEAFSGISRRLVLKANRGACSSTSYTFAKRAATQAGPTGAQIHTSPAIYTQSFGGRAPTCL